MLRKTAFLIGSLVLLTACGGPTTLSYTITSNLSDTTKNSGLFESSERVLVRRLAALGVENPKITIIPLDSSSATMDIEVPSEAKAAVEKITSDSFTFDLRVDNGKVKNDAGDEVTDWKKTRVDGSMVNWVQPVRDTKTGSLGVELQFSKDGKEALAEAFKGNKDKNIGIFVRDLLVSSMKITSEEPSEHIIISGIPATSIAEIFADDVNVGLHITFSSSR